MVVMMQENHFDLLNFSNVFKFVSEPDPLFLATVKQSIARSQRRPLRYVL